MSGLDCLKCGIDCLESAFDCFESSLDCLKSGLDCLESGRDCLKCADLGVVRAYLDDVLLGAAQSPLSLALTVLNVA